MLHGLVVVQLIIVSVAKFAKELCAAAVSPSPFPKWTRGPDDGVLVYS